MTEGQGNWARTTEMGKPWQEAITVEFGHDIWDITLAMMLDRITQAGQSGQVGMTGQPGQVRQDRTVPYVTVEAA